MANKEAGEKYIVDEEVEFLGAPVGDRFVEPEQQVAGYESITVELLNATDYKQWVKGAVYASLCTWDTTPHNPVSKLIEGSFEEMEKKLLFMLTKRPISVALEGATFTFKLNGVPRAMTHQIVRARQMAFGQQSYRVSSCYSDPVRIPVTLMERIGNGSPEDNADTGLLYANYVHAVETVRKVYKELIEAGIPMEQARCIMPMGTCTKIGVTMRLRDMIEYFKGRTGDIAQDEHTYIVCLMAKEMRDKQPEFFKFILSKVTNLESTMEKYNVK
jgi:flavin-dependent thymidylate synthase